uniref:Uncharacterized protein n=1 Tax=Fagus sylvatica TaxID=28930 RepID=A0A2N9FNP9_FAGSY
MTASSSLPSTNTHINTQTPIFLLSNISNYVTIKLDHSNYLMWKFQITGILDAYSLLDHLEDPTPCPSQFLFSHSETETQEVNPLYTQWRARDKALFSLISSTLSPSAISLVMGQTSASGIWKILVNRYTSVSRSNIVNLKRELNSIKKNSDSVTDYLHKIKEARNKLVSVGIHIDDEEILHIVLQGLPSEFHSFTSAMLTKNEAVKFEELHTLMKTEEDLLRSATDNSKEIAHMAMVANKSSQPTYNTSSNAQFGGHRGRGRNQNRGRGGYGGRFQTSSSGRGGGSSHGSFINGGNFSNFTPVSPNPQTWSSNPSSRPICQICYKPGHTALDCYQRMNFSYQGRHPPAKLAAMATATPPSPYPHQTTWISDTGATDHFTPDLHNIPDNQAYTDSQLVSVGNGNQLPISHSGNAQIRTSSHIFRLRQILRVPSMKSNLLSVQKFCRDNRTSFYFDANRFQIQDLLTGKPLYKGSSKDGLYPITGLSLPSWPSRVYQSQFSSKSPIPSQAALHASYTASLNQTALSSTDLWHMRLGHPQRRVLHHVLDRLFVSPKLPVSNTFFLGPAPSSPRFLSTASPNPSILGPAPLTFNSLPNHLTHPEPNIPQPTSEPTNILIPPEPIPLSISPHNPAINPATRLTQPGPLLNTSQPGPLLNTIQPAPSSSPNTVSPTRTNPENPTLANPENPAVSLSTHPMQTRSKSGISKKKSFATSTTIDYLQTEPQTYTIASKFPQWREAMASKFAALQRQQTWQLVPPSPDQNIVGCRWVYKIKRNSDGSVSRYKARLVAKGFHQQAGVDFAETFSPVVKPPTVRIILSLAAQNQWSLRQLDSVTVYLLLYVDDIIITRNSSSAVSDIISQLSTAFELKDLAASTPIATTPLLTSTSTECLSDPTPYRSLVGALQYATFTRPDITFAVNRVCQFMHKPSPAHFVAAKRILRYLKGTLDRGILFQPGPFALTAFTDADWAGDPCDRRSTSGIIVFLGNNPITWLAKKQHTVSRSSTEAEYRSLASGAAELSWIRQVLCDLGLFLPSAPLIWCDNTSALALASNPVFHGRTKHIEVDYHFIHERVVRGDLKLQFISTEDQLADVFTKALPSPRFHRLCSKLLICSTDHQFEGG